MVSWDLYFFNLFSVLISHRQYLAWGLVKFSTYLLSQSATVNIWLGDLWKFQLICWVNQSATVNIWLGDLWNFQLICWVNQPPSIFGLGTCENFNLFAESISHHQYLAWGLVKISIYLLSQSATVNIWLGDLWNFQLISILDSHLQYLAAGADEDANLSKVTLPVAQVAASKWISTCSFFSQRPYHAECTSSRPITEVKQHWALLVLGWETAWEHRVLLAFYFCWQSVLDAFLGQFDSIATCNEWRRTL